MKFSLLKSLSCLGRKWFKKRKQTNKQTKLMKEEEVARVANWYDEKKEEDEVFVCVWDKEEKEEEEVEIGKN